MTEQVQTEEKPNPYNAKKDWHEEDKPFSTSENLYFEEPADKNKLFDTSDVTEAEDKVNKEALEVEEDKPYKRPNYKKRYDDLKKHYDIKLNEFKIREEELINEATKNRTEYVTPKSPEELEQFKKDYPDVYEVVETVAHLQSESKAKVLEERLGKIQEREQQLIRQDAEKKVI